MYNIASRNIASHNITIKYNIHTCRYVFNIIGIKNIFNFSFTLAYDNLIYVAIIVCDENSNLLITHISVAILLKL